MSYYIYLISDYSHKNIHAGYCKDFIKMLETYKLLNSMSLNYPPDNYLSRVVYFEELNNESQAIERFNYFTGLPLDEKNKTVIEFNPEYIDLTLDPNFLEYVSN